VTHPKVVRRVLRAERLGVIATLNDSARVHGSGPQGRRRQNQGFTSVPLLAIERRSE
jgi:hypothetical protein